MNLYLDINENGDKKEPQTAQQKEAKEMAEKLLINMEQKFGYNRISAREAFSYLMKRRY